MRPSNYSEKEIAAICNLWKLNFSSKFIVTMIGLRKLHAAKAGKPSFCGIDLSILKELLVGTELIDKKNGKIFAEFTESTVVDCLAYYLNDTYGYDIVSELSQEYLSKQNNAVIAC